MTRRQLDEILSRVAGARSLVSSDRMCLGYTAGGNMPDVGRAVDCELRWRGSAVPWWLAPLRLITAANRTLFEVTNGRNVPSFVDAADSCFNVEVYSCSRTLLPAIVRHMEQAGVTASPGQVIEQDPGYFELDINCDGGPHNRWVVSSKCGSGCPEDLAAIARAVNDDGAADDA